MKKIIFICLVFIGIQACSEDTEQTDSTNLAGTSWAGIGDDEGEILTFVTETDYRWLGEGDVEVGTYTFDGENGILIYQEIDDRYETPFEIDGLKLILDGTEDNTYIKI